MPTIRPGRTYAILQVHKIKVETWQPDEVDLTDRRWFQPVQAPPQARPAGHRGLPRGLAIRLRGIVGCTECDV
jgi:hypothetical protein